MSHAPDNHDNALPFSVQKRIDAICDRFELAWKSAECPSLAEAIGEWDGADQEDPVGTGPGTRPSSTDPHQES